MTYNLASVRNRVLDDKLDDTEYDPNIIDRFINDTQRSIFNLYELPFQESVFNGVLPVGGVIFTFPVDYQLQQSLVITDPEGNQRDITDNYMNFRDFNNAYPLPSANDEGSPLEWTVHGGQLYLSRPTDQEYVLSLYYLKKPTKLEDDADVPEIPEEFEEVLVLGAYHRALSRNEDFDQAAYVKNSDYAEEVDKLVSRYGRRQTGKVMIMGQPLRRQFRGR